MGFFQRFGAQAASLTQSLTRGASSVMKSPFGHAISNVARQGISLAQSLDKASGGALGMAAREAVGKIPLASSAIEYFSKGMAVKKSLESSLKRARVEAKGALSRSRKKVY